MIDNKISLIVSPAQKAAIEAAIEALRTALTGPVNLLNNLTAEERQSIPKIGDKTLAFDQKCDTYMTQNPVLVPGFVNRPEYDKDGALVDALLPCLRALTPLCEGLSDTITVAFSDRYYADLSFYQSVKTAAQRNVAGSDTIYNDLKQRWPGPAKKTTPTPNP
jgi:hypothetical protein